MSTLLVQDLGTPVREGITTFTTFVPRLLGLLAILLVGWSGSLGGPGSWRARG